MGAYLSSAGASEDVARSLLQLAAYGPGGMRLSAGAGGIEIELMGTRLVWKIAAAFEPGDSLVTFEVGSDSENSSKGIFKLVADQRTGTGFLVEMVTPPMNMLDDEKGFVDKKAVFKAIDNIVARIRTIPVGESRSMTDIFPASEGFQVHPKAVSVGIERVDDKVWAKLAMHYTVGVALEAVNPFLRWVAEQRLLLPSEPSVARALRIVQDGLDFGVEIAEMFHGGDVSDELRRPGLARIVAGYITEAYFTPGAAMIHIHDPNDKKKLLKNYLLAALRNHLFHLRRELPVEVQLFLDAYAPQIRDRFVQFYTERNPAFVAELAEASGDDAFDLLDTQLPGFEHSVGEYIDNALVSDPSRVIDPKQALGIGTWMGEPDSYGGRLGDLVLVLLEMRFFGKHYTRDPAGILGDYERLEAKLQQLHREIVRFRAADAQDEDGAGRDAGLLVEDVVAQLQSIGVTSEQEVTSAALVSGPETSVGAYRVLKAVRWAVLELMVSWRARPGVLDLSGLHSVLGRVPAADRELVGLAAVESFQAWLDGPARAAVRSVVTGGVGVPAAVRAAARRRFPAAQIVDAAQAAAQAVPDDLFGPVVPGDYLVFPTAKRSGFVFTELVDALTGVAPAQGVSTAQALSALAERIGVWHGLGAGERLRRAGRSPAENARFERRMLLHVARLTARVFGVDGLTEARMVLMRRLVHARVPDGGPRLTEWGEVEDLVRQVRRDPGWGPAGAQLGAVVRPVPLAHVQRVLDAVTQAKTARAGNKLRRQVRVADLQRVWAGQVQAGRQFSAGRQLSEVSSRVWWWAATGIDPLSSQQLAAAERAVWAYRGGRPVLAYPAGINGMPLGLDGQPLAETAQNAAAIGRAVQVLVDQHAPQLGAGDVVLMPVNDQPDPAQLDGFIGEMAQLEIDVLRVQPSGELHVGSRLDEPRRVLDAIDALLAVDDWPQVRALLDRHANLLGSGKVLKSLIDRRSRRDPGDDRLAALAGVVALGQRWRDFADRYLATNDAFARRGLLIDHLVDSDWSDPDTGALKWIGLLVRGAANRGFVDDADVEAIGMLSTMRTGGLLPAAPHLTALLKISSSERADWARMWSDGIERVAALAPQDRLVLRRSIVLQEWMAADDWSESRTLLAEHSSVLLSRELYGKLDLRPSVFGPRSVHMSLIALALRGLADPTNNHLVGLAYDYLTAPDAGSRRGLVVATVPDANTDLLSRLVQLGLGVADPTPSDHAGWAVTRMLAAALSGRRARGFDVSLRRWLSRLAVDDRADWLRTWLGAIGALADKRPASRPLLIEVADTVRRVAEQAASAPGVSGRGAGVGGALLAPPEVVLSGDVGEFGSVLGLLAAGVLADYRAEVELWSEQLSDPDRRLGALVELDKWLSRRVVLSAAAGIVFGEVGGFDPVSGLVTVPEGLTDPHELGSALLHEMVHREQTHLMWREVLRRLGPGTTADELAVEVGTADVAAAAAAVRAGPLLAGSLQSAAAARWQADAGAWREAFARARAAYGVWRRARDAARAQGLDEQARAGLVAAEWEAERAYRRVWWEYARLSPEKAGFAAQVSYAANAPGGMRSADGGGPVPGPPRSGPSHTDLLAEAGRIVDALTRGVGGGLLRVGVSVPAGVDGGDVRQRLETMVRLRLLQADGPVGGWRIEAARDGGAALVSLVWVQDPDRVVPEAATASGAGVAGSGEGPQVDPPAGTAATSSWYGPTLAEARGVLAELAAPERAGLLAWAARLRVESRMGVDEGLVGQVDEIVGAYLSSEGASEDGARSLLQRAAYGPGGMRLLAGAGGGVVPAGLRRMARSADRVGRSAERVALRGQLAAWGAPALPAGVLGGLVDARRSYRRDGPSGGFTGDLAHDYRPMVLDLLGRDSWDLNTLNDLVGLVGAARGRWVGRHFTRRHLRRRHLVAEVVRSWQVSSAVADPVTSAEEQGYSQRLPRLQYLSDAAFVSELTRWLNEAATPGLDGQIGEQEVSQKLTWGLLNLLDEGLEFDTRDFTVTLFAVPVDEVTSGDMKPVKIEQRVNAIVKQADNAEGRTTGGFVEVGVALSGGLPGVAVAGFTARGGGGSMTGRAVSEQLGFGDYKYTRPDLPAREVTVPLRWWVRVTPKAEADQGRSTVVHWRHAGGAARHETVSMLVLPHEVLPISPDVRTLNGNEELPLRRMHIVVEGLGGLAALRAQVRRRVGDELYLRWRDEIELFLSQDRVGAVLPEAADAHVSYGVDAPQVTPTGDDRPGWTDVPRLMLADADGKGVSLALTARLRSTSAVGQPSPDNYAKYDDITVTSKRKSVRSEHHRTRRIMVLVPARVVERIVNVRSRFTHSRSRARMFVTSRWDQHFRSLRSMRENRVLQVDFDLTVHVGRPKQAPVPITAPAWAQVRVQTGELDAVRRGTFDTTTPAAAAGGAADVSALTWWTPALDAGGNFVAGTDFGVGFGRVTKATGMAEIYNQVVPRLVTDGYLPAKALNTEGGTHWAKLMGLAVTGDELSGSGVAEENWRALADFLSHRSFVHRIDDLMGAGAGQPGATATLRHPSDTNRHVTLGVSGRITGTVAADRTDPKMPINVLFSTNDWFHGRPLDRDNERLSDLAAKGPVEAGAETDASGEGKPVGAVGNPPLPKWRGLKWARWLNSRTRTRDRAYAFRVGTTVMTYARTTGKTSRYQLPVTFDWRLYDDRPRPAPTTTTTAGGARAGSAVGSVEMWQPDVLAGLPRGLPALDVDGPSALEGLTARAPLDVSGVPRLQRALIETRRSGGVSDGVGTRSTAKVNRGTAKVKQKAETHAAGLPGVGDLFEPATDRAISDEVWNGITQTTYKVNLPRALSPAGAVVFVGDRHGLLQVRPVGRVQILDKIEGYTEVMQEKQVGHDSFKSRRYTEQSRVGVGYNPGDQAGGPVGTPLYVHSAGEGESALRGRTEGGYRSLAGVSDLYVARFSVRNIVLLEDGTTTEQPGEVVMELDAAEVDAAYAATPDRFHDVGNKLPPVAAPAVGPAQPDRQPPPSLADGHFWEGVFTEKIAGSGPSLAVQVMHAAQELGGTELRVKVAPLMVGLGVHLPELEDGGQSFTIDAGGHAYVLTLTARKPTASRPRHVRDEPISGKHKPPRMVWLHNRSNDFATRSRRKETTKAVQVRTGGGGDFGAGAAYGYVTASVAKTKERVRSTAVNVLRMSGTRPNGVSRFAPQIRFDWQLQRLPGGVRDRANRARLRPNWSHRSGHVVEDYNFHAPIDVSPRPGLNLYTSGRRLHNVLPDDTIIIGSYGFRAVAERAQPHGKRVRRGKLPAEGMLTHDVFNQPQTLATMQTAAGARFTSIRAGYLGDDDLDLSKHPITTHAQLGVPHFIARIKQGEREYYDHGTRVGSQAQPATTTVNVDGTVTVRVQTPVTVSTGPSLGAGALRSRTKDAAGHSDQTEHRNWVRWTSPHYLIYTQVTYTHTINGTETPYQGVTSLVVSAEGARQLGLTDADLAAADTFTTNNQTPPVPTSTAQITASGQAAAADSAAISDRSEALRAERPVQRLHGRAQRLYQAPPDLVSLTAARLLDDLVGGEPGAPGDHERKLLTLARRFRVGGDDSSALRELFLRAAAVVAVGLIRNPATAQVPTGLDYDFALVPLIRPDIVEASDHRGLRQLADRVGIPASTDEETLRALRQRVDDRSITPLTHQALQDADPDEISGTYNVLGTAQQMQRRYGASADLVSLLAARLLDDLAGDDEPNLLTLADRVGIVGIAGLDDSWMLRQLFLRAAAVAAAALMRHLYGPLAPTGADYKAKLTRLMSLYIDQPSDYPGLLQLARDLGIDESTDEETLQQLARRAIAEPTTQLTIADLQTADPADISRRYDALRAARQAPTTASTVPDAAGDPSTAVLVPYERLRAAADRVVDQLTRHVGGGSLVVSVSLPAGVDRDDVHQQLESMVRLSLLQIIESVAPWRIQSAAEGSAELVSLVWTDASDHTTPMAATSGAAGAGIGGAVALSVRGGRARLAVLEAEFGVAGAGLLLDDAAAVVRRVGLGVAEDEDLAVRYPVVAGPGVARHGLSPAAEVGLVVGDSPVLLDVAEALRVDYGEAVAVARAYSVSVRGAGAVEPAELAPGPNRVSDAARVVVAGLGRYAAWTPPDGDCWFSAVLRAARDVPNPPPPIAALASLTVMGLRRLLGGQLDGDDVQRTRLRALARDPADWDAFRGVLEQERQWTHPVFDGFLELAPQLLGIRIHVINLDGSERVHGPAGAAELFVLRTSNHYLPLLRRPGGASSGVSAPGAGVGGALLAPPEVVLSGDVGEFGSVLGLLAAGVLPAYRAEVELWSEQLSDPDRRLGALIDLDKWLSRRVGLSAAAGIVFGEVGGFDPVSGLVTVPEGLIDPHELGSALLHEMVHREQTHLMWREVLGRLRSGTTGDDLAVEVGTADVAAAAAAVKAGPLLAGSLQSAAAARWQADAGAWREAFARARAAYGVWRKARDAARAQGLDEQARAGLVAAEWEAERAYRRVWWEYARLSPEKAGFAAQVSYAANALGGMRSADGGGPDPGPPRSGPSHDGLVGGGGADRRRADPGGGWWFVEGGGVGAGRGGRGRCAAAAGDDGASASVAGRRAGWWLADRSGPGRGCRIGQPGLGAGSGPGGAGGGDGLRGWCGG